MRKLSLPLVTAAALGFAAAALLFAVAAPRPVDAQQFQGGTTFGGLPIGGLGNVPNTAAAAAPQPIQVEGLDTEHFVVATREPRLVQQIGREGTAQQMLVTVVTHYTVRGDRLIPVEHVRVPSGFRAITLDN